MLTRLLLLLDIPATFAQESFIPEGGGGCDIASGDIQASCIPGFIAHIIAVIFSFTGGICLILILFAGYRILLATATGGDKSSGIELLRWAIIGFIASALTFFIIDFIISSIVGL